MDSAEHFNLISEHDYRNFLSKALEESFKSITFSFSTIFKIYAQASKKCVLFPIHSTQAKKTEASTFEKFALEIKSFSKEIEAFSKSIFNSLLFSMEDDKIIPQSLKALIDDTIRDRELIMNNKVDNHKRHTDLIRQLNSLVSVVET